MSIVDKVKNPLDNNEFLKEMILLYAKQLPETRKSGSYIYDEIIRHPESEKNANKDAYIWNFKKFVEQDTICKLLTEKLGYSKQDSIRIYMDLFLDGKDDSSLGIDKGDFVSKLEESGLIDVHYDEKYMQMPVKDILKSIFHTAGIMGYHVHKTKFGSVWDFSNDTVKFYINAGEYTYEFSKIFKQKCEEQGMKYTYKIADPEEDEENRADKMCIYMGLDEIEDYLAIVREIRLDHPEFEYRASAPLMGSIDGWIGIGADPDNFELASSYCDSRALLIENSLSKVLGNASEKKIKKMMEKNPEQIISKLRAEIERRAAVYSITKHFVFDDVIVQALELPPRERIDEYSKNRNKLFNHLPSEKSKHSTIDKILGFFRSMRERKSKTKTNNQRANSIQLPDTQTPFPGAEDQDDDEYRARLQLDLDKLGQIPITQESIDRANDGTSIDDDEPNHDDNDVII